MKLPIRQKRIVKLNHSVRDSSYSIMTLIRFLVFLMAGILATPSSTYAEHPDASNFFRHTSDLQLISLYDGINLVTLFGPKLKSGQTGLPQPCDYGCPVPGAILAYHPESFGVGNLATYVPLVVTNDSDGSPRTFSIIHFDYIDTVQNSAFELPGSGAHYQQQIVKFVAFFQAKYYERPTTLLFISELDGLTKDGASEYDKISVFEFTQLHEGYRVRYAFRPILSFTARGGYFNARTALWTFLRVRGLED